MVANESFFQRKQAAAVLKHGILARYPLIFATMTGSQTGRVVYFDGYAGPGRYEDGSPGSPLLAVRSAARTATWGRTVTCFFCEKDMDYFTDLQRVLEEEAPAELKYETWWGDVSQWAPVALREAGTDPMITLLDPFGSDLSYELLTGGLLARPSRHATEVILNLNLESVWRTGGYLTSPKKIPGSAAALARLDRFFGDDWWRDKFKAARESGTDAAAAAAAWSVASEFCQRVRAATGFSSFVVPVRRRPSHPPLFMLVLFYRHPYAPWKFNHAVSKANREWRLACLEADLDKEASRLASAPEGLFDTAESIRAQHDRQRREWESQEKSLESSWAQEIAANLQKMIGERSEMNLTNEAAAVFGATLGLARDTHVNRAWDQLARDGVVTERPRNQRLERAILRRPRA